MKSIDNYMGMGKAAMGRGCNRVALIFSFGLTLGGGLISAEEVELWDRTVEFPPGLSEIPPLHNVTYRNVQRGTAGVDQYLHECGIEWHQGLLYVGWSSSQRDESAEDKQIVGRFSRDGGVTWSEVVTIAPRLAGRERWEYANFVSHRGELWLLTTRIHSGWDFADPKVEAFVMGEDPRVWERRGVVIDDEFVATGKPRRMANGCWILAGMCEDKIEGRRVGRNRLAISEGDELTSWSTGGIEHPKGMRFPFMTPLVQGNRITAVVRNSLETKAMLATSEDFGKTWSPAGLTNFPATGMKSFAGVLSDGTPYFIAATPEKEGSHLRKALTISLGSAGGQKFQRIFRISRGEPHPMRFEGKGKGPGPGQWSYPKAVEHDGHLYVVYTVNKEDAEMAVIPLESLK